MDSSFGNTSKDLTPVVSADIGTTSSSNNGLLAALASSGLTQEQQEGVGKALAYIQELQQTVFKDVLDAEKKRREEENKVPAGTVNPGLLAGMDARTLSVISRIYVGSINFELTDEHIHRVFSEFGSVCSVSMSKDPATGRHKGFGFVEYEVPEAAALALETMNGTMLGGRQLKIGRPNNYGASVAQGFPPPPPERIYVANVNRAIAEDVLREIFAPFGTVVACVLSPDMATRQHRGWGFIEFADAAAAEQAARDMDRFLLGNLVLRVRLSVVGGPLGEGMAALDSLPEPTEGKPQTASPAQTGPPQQVVDMAAIVDRSIGAAADTAQPSSTTASSIVLLENVVGGRADVDDDLAADMAVEGVKCGKIAKVVVHVASERELQQTGSPHSEVSIFLQYVDVASAKRALELFDGRWFAGRQVNAQLYDPDAYRVLTSADTMVYMP
ncbi:hypothetical protein IWW45_006521 [Coemansia sp. RSA 485]|nr:hypothetical protein IWW45_006521 [Coemansia sp. RSA 485]